MTGYHIYPEIMLTDEEKFLIEDARKEREGWQSLPRAERRRKEREYRKEWLSTLNKIRNL